MFALKLFQVFVQATENSFKLLSPRARDSSSSSSSSESSARLDPRGNLRLPELVIKYGCVG